MDLNFEKAPNELHMFETARHWVASYAKVSSPRGVVRARMGVHPYHFMRKFINIKVVKPHAKLVNFIGSYRHLPLLIWAFNQLRAVQPSATIEIQGHLQVSTKKSRAARQPLERQVTCDVSV